MGQKLKRLTCVPHFDRARVASGDDGFAIGRELHGHDGTGIGVLDLGDLIQALCAKEEARESGMHQGYQARALRAPASQTLIVLSSEPETIVLPSGEKATEVMSELWAFCCSFLSSSVPVKGVGRG